MPTFLVIGIYADNHQPFAQDFTANNAEGASTQAQDFVAAEGNEIWIAGVYEVHPHDLDALECNDFARLKNVA